MPIYVTEERDDVEEEQSEQGPIDDQYRHLEQEILMKDINTAAMTARMEVLMAQLRTTPGQNRHRGC